MNIRTPLLAAAVAALLSTQSMAADIVEAPPAIPSWTAFYLGAGVGAAWSDFNTYGNYYSECGCEYFFDFRDLAYSDSETTFRGIGQLGFDLEVGSGLVLGAFGDVNFGQQAGVSNTYHYQDSYDYDVHDKFSYDLGALWTVGGRVGFGAENALFYGLVGYSWADSDSKLSIGCNDGTSQCWRTAKNDGPISGWTFGGGIEYKGWMWDALSTSIEYRYTDLDAITATVRDGSDYYRTRVDQDIQQVNLVFKYRIGI
ncbi:outer membrane protein [Aestuariivirga sp.]|uniref:outer membrane protein n=1 Tax=Aestuariivirga sp. TaxID=2650926 RepID=UPI003BADA56F